MGLLKGLIFLGLLTLAIGFALYNDELISLRYYFGWESIPLPLFLWAFLAFIIGLIISAFYAFLAKINMRFRLQQMKRLIAAMEKKRITSAQNTE